jgi:hypothetical protein
MLTCFTSLGNVKYVFDIFVGLHLGRHLNCADAEVLFRACVTLPGAMSGKRWVLVLPVLRLSKHLQCNKAEVVGLSRQGLALQLSGCANSLCAQPYMSAVKVGTAACERHF